MEGLELGAFMVSACLFGILLFHPASPAVRAIPNPDLRRLLIGIAMGLTAIAIIYSPWGKRSGAHFNPSVTLTFFRLGKVSKWDAVFYPAAQIVGSVLGVGSVALFARSLLQTPEVNYVATIPGKYGLGVAFAGEFVIAFLQMTMVLHATSREKIARYTGLFAGTLVATYITLEGPLSGMSMNPARTFGSAFVSQMWTGLWIYFSAPVLAMLLAAEVFKFTRQSTACAKLHHQNATRCIFCEFQQWKAEAGQVAAAS